jgi:preprotein translocase subunit SecG
MKTTHILGIIFLFIILVFALVIANFNPSFASAQNTAASISLQTTPTPIGEGTSVIGSTDGIMLMGVIISMIVIVPVLFRRKKN